MFKLLLRFFALPHSSLAPPRNPPGELFIAQPVADIFQPRVCALPFQIGERFLQWHVLAQCSQCAEKQGLSPVLRQALGQRYHHFFVMALPAPGTTAPLAATPDQEYRHTWERQTPF
ncbi:MAG: hypothetical protein M3Z24_12435 [Chloroflexota bacterium]|nr:hypothetical protein [Chloroflexota bacterium]